MLAQTLSKVAALHPPVASFRITRIRSREEFKNYLRKTDELRGARWLYEQSIASPKSEIVIAGTCGICLRETRFTAPTAGGEPVAGGRVPNWREGLTCDCEWRLINRQRALLHYLLATASLQPWMRVLGLGELGALRVPLAEFAGEFSCFSGQLNNFFASGVSTLNQNFHLVVSVEQFNTCSCQPEILGALAGLLKPGGRLVFTAPFDVTESQSMGQDKPGPLGWSILEDLLRQGFIYAEAGTYWSEEFGYLGPFNFIFNAAKIS